MKRFFTLLLCAVAVTAVQAKQKNSGGLHNTKAYAAPARGAGQRGTAGPDTLFMPASFYAASPCFSALGVYTNDRGDYIAGTNTFQDKEILMRYALKDYNALMPASIDTVSTLFGFKHLFGNGNLRAKVYASDVQGRPGLLLGVSSDLSVSQVDTAGGYTHFIFATPVSLTTDSFFLSVDVSSLYATKDSVALISTDSGCATADSGRAWSLVSDGNFYPFADSANNWGSPYDVAIFPSITALILPPATTGIGTYHNNRFAASVYPVPATNTLNISFNSFDSEDVLVSLSDITGKTVASSLQKSAQGRVSTATFEVGSLTRGLYFVTLTTATGKEVIKATLR